MFLDCELPVSFRVSEFIAIILSFREQASSSWRQMRLGQGEQSVKRSDGPCSQQIERERHLLDPPGLNYRRCLRQANCLAKESDSAPIRLDERDRPARCDRQHETRESRTAAQIADFTCVAQKRQDGKTVGDMSLENQWQVSPRDQLGRDVPANQQVREDAQSLACFT